MSWNFEVKGKQKTEVMNALHDEAMRQRAHTPVDKVLAVATLAMTEMPEGSVTSIHTFGHKNEDGSGNFCLSVNC